MRRVTVDLHVSDVSFISYHSIDMLRSVRRDFIAYAMGTIIGAGKTLFHEDVQMTILDDLSTDECRLYDIRSQLCSLTMTCRLDGHALLSVQFDNKKYQVKSLINFPLLPNLRGETIFRVINEGVLFVFDYEQYLVFN
jgi:hypothetical protein